MNHIRKKRLRPPKRVSGTSSQVVTIPYRDTEYVFQVSIPNKLIAAMEIIQRDLPQSESVELSLPEKLGIFYDSIICDKEQEETLTIFLSAFAYIRNKLSLNDDEYVDLLVSYVQGLTYDYHRAEVEDVGVYYPVQTIHQNSGVCEDMALLLEALLFYSGFDVAHLVFPKENHAMAGIRVNNSGGMLGTGYSGIETTVTSLIGEFDHVHTELDFYPLKPGRWNKTYSSVKENKRILEFMNNSSHPIQIRETVRKYVSVKNQRKALEVITSYTGEKI